MVKKLLAGILAILLLALCGCGKVGFNVDSGSSEEKENPTSSAPQINSESPAQSAWEFYGIEWHPGELGAVAFIGFAEDVFAEHILAEFDKFDEQYGSFSGGSISGVQAEGEEVYLIIPRWSDTAIAVEEIGKDGSWELIYSGDATPFLLCCNSADIYRNTMVTFNCAQGETALSPAYNFIDGHMAVEDNGPIREIRVSSDTGGAGDGLDEALLGDWRMYRVLDGEALITYIWTFCPNGTVEYHIYWDGEVTESYSGNYAVFDDSGDLSPDSFIFDMTLLFLREGYGELNLNVGDEISGEFTFTFDRPDTLVLGYVEGSPMLYLQDSPEYFDYVYERVVMMG